MMKRLPALSISALAAISMVGALAGCSDESSDASDDSEATEDITPAEQTEVSSISPRIVLSHDEGLTTLDAESGETVDTVEEEGFFRLENAGDGQHVMVNEGNEFTVYNSGIRELPHGDHSHYYTSDPGMTGAEFDADHAGHVVRHDGRTTLFADGTGEITTFTAGDLQSGMPETDTTTTDDPHHGVAIELSDGSLLSTEGTEDSRDTIKHLEDYDSDEELSSIEDCPEVHGEAAAASSEDADLPDNVVFGCENGPVLFSNGEFEKINLPDDIDGDFQRSGNLVGSEESPIVLGDNKTDPDAEFERPESVALIDTSDASMQTVDLDDTYWFRSLARGPEGEAIVLTADGQLNVIDEESGEITDQESVIEPWEENEDWQQPGPILQVAGDQAYITDAEEEKVVIVDLDSLETVDEFDLDFAPTEMAVVDGLPETSVPEDEQEEAADEAHGDEGYDHDHDDEGEDHDH